MSVLGGSRGAVRASLAASLIVLVLLIGGGLGFTFLGGTTMGNNLVEDNLSAPLGGATSAEIDIDSDLGHLKIGQLAGGEQLLANGTLQYFEKQGAPSRSVNMTSGRATLTVRGGGTAKTWFRLPWAGCGGAYGWQIHLNPKVASDIKLHTNGGNVELDLAGMVVTSLSAVTAGGNMKVTLPDHAANLGAKAATGGGNVIVEVGSGITGTNVVNAESGGGNVEVRVPSGTAAKVLAASGLGKVIVDPQFSRVDGSTYVSAGYNEAVNRVEITAKSGAGNVIISIR